MGWKDFFKKKDTPTPDPLTDLVLPNLQVGNFVDYDMKTWEVKAYHYYDWGSEDLTFEWQLTSHDETLFLEREPDDEDYWSVSQKIPISRLNPEFKDRILANESPPDTLEFEGTVYYLEETGAGHFHKNGEETTREILKWDYMDESGKKLLSIEQWGEADFEASIGKPVEEYQFINILPGKDG